MYVDTYTLKIMNLVLFQKTAEDLSIHKVYKTKNENTQRLFIYLFI